MAPATLGPQPDLLRRPAAASKASRSLDRDGE